MSSHSQYQIIPFPGIVRDLKPANINTAHPDSSNLAVGYENRTNFMVHVGRDQWIPKQEWTYAFSLTCPRDFTRHLAFHLFGLETLRKSTLTGKPSNRSKNKDIERKKPKPDKLDDSVIFFLKADKFKEMKSHDKEAHILSIGSYITAYIADLKKSKKSDETKDVPNPKRKRSSERAELRLDQSKRRKRDEQSTSKPGGVSSEENKISDGEEERDEIDWMENEKTLEEVVDRGHRDGTEIDDTNTPRTGDCEIFTAKKDKFANDDIDREFDKDSQKDDNGDGISRKYLKSAFKGQKELSSNTDCSVTEREDDISENDANDTEVELFSEGSVADPSNNSISQDSSDGADDDDLFGTRVPRY
ncbi:hypothetical protein QAD02_021385 [Eretmocerus hayati]|uniref:Uncharacterized protein n=1 Tax=Eretmocerus hayati TaxID=131215 RepID=A0ACC2PQB3_9HYME|nr:hypothetical protein QAD02_021385 [Eretmocerus hayati]